MHIANLWNYVFLSGSLLFFSPRPSICFLLGYKRFGAGTSLLYACIAPSIMGPWSWLGPLGGTVIQIHNHKNVTMNLFSVLEPFVCLAYADTWGFQFYSQKWKWKVNFTPDHSHQILFDTTGLQGSLIPLLEPLHKSLQLCCIIYNNETKLNVNSAPGQYIF